MKRELTLAVVIGLLWGTAMIVPGATVRVETAKRVSSKPVKELVLPAGNASKKSLSSYQVIQERNLFKPTIQPEAVAPPVTEDILPDFGGIPVIEPVPSPTQGWVYAGYAMLDNETIAILKEQSSGAQGAGGGSAVFLRKGDAFRTGIVEEITPENIRLSFNGNVEMLRKSNEYTTLPLNQPTQQAVPGRAVPPTAGMVGRGNRQDAATGDLQDRNRRFAERMARRMEEARQSRMQRMQGNNSGNSGVGGPMMFPMPGMGMMGPGMGGSGMMGPGAPSR